MLHSMIPGKLYKITYDPLNAPYRGPANYEVHNVVGMFIRIVDLYPRMHSYYEFLIKDKVVQLADLYNFKRVL
jgi:hypothetical protein